MERYWIYGISLSELKGAVKAAHARKVAAWNRLASNPHTRQNENHYYHQCDSFGLAVERLLYFYKLCRARRQYFAPKSV